MKRTHRMTYVVFLGWRPTFKFYNKWLSLAGTIMCFVVMFLMDYRTAAATIIWYADWYF
jgi:hypothetical protein